MRKVFSSPNGTALSFTVFYDFDYEEFVVKLFKDGAYQPDADYFTNDQDDAVNTGFAMLEPVNA